MAYVSNFLTDTAGITAPETSWNVFRNPDIDNRLYELNIYSSVYYKILELLTEEEDAKQPRFDWAEDDIPARTTAVNNVGGYANNATSIVVDDSTVFIIGHVIRSMTHNELLLITDINDSTKTLTVTRGYAGSSAAVLDNNEVLMDMGMVLGENGDAPNARGKIPTEKYNYIEMKSRTFAISELQQTTDMRYDVGKIPRETLEKAFSIRRDFAMALLYGKRSKTTAADGNTAYTTGGFYEFATENGLSTSASGLTWTTLYGWAEEAFIPTESSPRKILLCGSGVAQAITQIAYDKTRFAEYNDVLGQQVNILRLPSGNEIEIIQDPYTFSSSFGTEKKGILIDTKHISLKWKEGWRLRWKQNIQNNYTHGRKDEIYGACGLKLKHPEVHGTITLT